MALPTLPPPVELSAETKKAIIDGLKKVIETFQAKGVIDAAWSYQDIIHAPEILQAFIKAYRDNRELVDEVVTSAEGEAVRDEETALVCGVTLGQVQQLLVKTCAKFYFERDREDEMVTETRTTKRFLFFTKTEQVERKATTSDDRKFREVLNWLAFDWQLPLVPALKEMLTYQQVAEIGEGLIGLRTPQAIAVMAEYDPALIKKARAATRKDWVAVLAHRPDALPGIGHWSPEMYMFFRATLKGKAWDFFAREKSFFNVVADLDKPTARIYGDVLCYIAPENLAEIQRLNIDKTDVLIQSLKTALGPQAPNVLSLPAFAKDFLRKLVESLLHMQQEKDQLLVSTQLTCKALIPQVADWLERQKAA